MPALAPDPVRLPLRQSSDMICWYSSLCTSRGSSFLASGNISYLKRAHIKGYWAYCTMVSLFSFYLLFICKFTSIKKKKICGIFTPKSCSSPLHSTVLPGYHFQVMWTVGHTHFSYDCPGFSTGSIVFPWTVQVGFSTKKYYVPGNSSTLDKLEWFVTLPSTHSQILSYL